MNSLYKKITGCRLCQSNGLKMILDLRMQSLTGCFPKLEEDCPKPAPLVLVRCENCGLVQLEHSVSPEEMFGDSYGYRSGLNESMKRHLESIAKSIEESVLLESGDIVLDIGCNDGTLLGSFTRPNIKLVGMDPVANQFRDKHKDSFEIFPCFFTSEVFKNSYKQRKAKVITSISMFYDLENPQKFTNDVASILDKDGIWVLEQSYLPKMLEQNSFDTICHEHLEYYALRQIERLVKNANLKIINVSLNNINGGSFRVEVSHEKSRLAVQNEAISRLKAYERNLNLDRNKTYEDFAKRVDDIGKKLRHFLKEEKSKDKEIFVYGASTKGNVLLQYFDLDNQLITACAERNTDKFGCKTPGSQIPIISEKEARDRADYFLVLPWHFRGAFLEREKRFLEKGGKFIFPLPEVDIVGYSDLN